MKVHNKKIIYIEGNEIFVFGSNQAGRHGKGAARDAIKFGAEYGNGEGIQGRTYAIPTKDKNLRVLPLSSIMKNVSKFKNFAAQNPDLKFLVTEIGCGEAGYSPSQIAPMFKNLLSDNVFLPRSFREELLLT